MTNELFGQLQKKIVSCKLCEKELPVKPNPIVQINPNARILVAGQAPGRIVHETSIPFNDVSGNRLRDWMGINKSTFYDANLIAIVPMGFCYPGTGKSGDLPPRKECAVKWRNKVLNSLPNIQLTLLIGQYAMKWHLGKKMQATLTETVKNGDSYPKNLFPLPHPSPRNYGWMKKNPWFETRVLPNLRKRIYISLEGK